MACLHTSLGPHVLLVIGCSGPGFVCMSHSQVKQIRNMMNQRGNVQKARSLDCILANFSPANCSFRLIVQVAAGRTTLTASAELLSHETCGLLKQHACACFGHTLLLLFLVWCIPFDCIMFEHASNIPLSHIESPNPSFMPNMFQACHANHVCSMYVMRVMQNSFWCALNVQKNT